MMNEKRSGIFLALAAVGLVASTGTALAQLPGDAAGRLLDEATRTQAAPAKAAPSDILKVEPKADVARPRMADTGLKVKVAGFKFIGNTILGEEELLAVVQPFLGKEVGLGGLNDAAEAVKRLYRNKGFFLAQAYIPAQAIKDGQVEIAVLEGRIDKVTVKVADGAPVSAAYAEELIAQHVHQGDVISEAGIETPLLLLRDLPRLDARSVIEPGSAVGTATLRIDVTGDATAPAVSGKAELDNYGSRVSGATRLGAEVNFNSPLGLGDQLSLKGFATSQNGNTFGRAGYTLPVGPWGTRLGANVARLNYALGKNFTDLKADGVADVASIYAVHPLVRTKNFNLFGQVGFDDKHLTDRTVATEEKRRVQAVKLQLNGDSRDSLLGINSFGLTAAFGDLKIPDATLNAADQGITGAHTAGKFTKINYEFQRLQQLVPGFNGLVSVQGQTASKNLTSAEKFAVGGANSVRAYPVGEAVGDEGYALTGEVRYAIPELHFGKGDVVATAFYDYGRVTKNKENDILADTQNTRSIAGYGVGLNIGAAGDYLVNTSVAWRAQGGAPQGQGEPDKRPRIWVQGTLWF